MRNLSQADTIALIDSCLDDKMNFREMIDTLRCQTGDGLLMTCDAVVEALRHSSHPSAPRQLRDLKQRISRYNHLALSP